MGSRIAFLDIEASGLGEGSWPVEIGWCDPWRPERRGSVLVRPLPHWTHWSPIAEEFFHRISRADLERDGLPPDEALRAVEEAVGDCQVYVEDPFEDRAWFARLGEAGRAPALVLNDARGLFEAQAARRRHDLAAVRRQIALRFPHTHRAAADARQMAELWRALSR